MTPKRLALPILYIALAGYFGANFYRRYWLWRDCLAGNGRCYDPVADQVLTSGGMIWGIASVLLLAFAVRAWRRAA